MLSQRQEAARNESGFVLTFVAIAVVALLTVGAIAFDVTTWVVRANKLQSDAEAAAMGGVVFMPYQFEKAKAAALDVLADNKVTPSSTLSVTISRVEADPRQLSVSITDSNVRSFLGTFAVKKIAITREATAVYEAPISVGSPQNRFGVGSGSIGAGESQHFWAAVNGYCSEARSGDLLQTGFLKDETSSAYWDCYYPSSSANPHYNGNTGYIFDVDLSNTAVNQRLQLYDATFLKQASDRKAYTGYCEYRNSSDPTQDTVYPSTNCDTVTLFTTFTVMWDKNRTPFDPTDDVLVQTPTKYPTVTNCSSSIYCKQWQDLVTLTAGQRYRVTVNTDNNSNLNSRGVNSFAMRLKQSGSQNYSVCSTDRTYSGPPSPTCPTIAAENVMSGFFDGFNAASHEPAGAFDPRFFHPDVTTQCQKVGGTGTCFYLAQIAPNYAGKQAVVTMFDLDSGTESVRIAMPDEDAPGDHSFVGPDQHLNYTDTNGNVIVPNTMNYNFVQWSPDAYNGKTLTISFTIPSDYDCDVTAQSTSKPSCWWYLSFRYTTTGQAVHDRATWSVQILGDPVHLIK